jgi:hypothetical protein
MPDPATPLGTIPVSFLKQPVRESDVWRVRARESRCKTKHPISGTQGFRHMRILAETGRRFWRKLVTDSGGKLDRNGAAAGIL